AEPLRLDHGSIDQVVGLERLQADVGRAEFGIQPSELQPATAVFFICAVELSLGLGGRRRVRGVGIALYRVGGFEPSCLQVGPGGRISKRWCTEAEQRERGTNDESAILHDCSPKTSIAQMNCGTRSRSAESESSAASASSAARCAPT